MTANIHLVVAAGNSPNGAGTATFITVVQSIGLVERGARTTLVPALSIGLTRTTRRRYAARESAFGLWAMASIGVALHR